MTTRFLRIISLFASFHAGIASASLPADTTSVSDVTGQEVATVFLPSGIEPGTEHHNLYTNTIGEWTQNPALRFDAYSTSYGELGIFANKRREHQAFVLQEGNMQYTMGIGAASYRRLGKLSASRPSEGDGKGTIVWGSASYEFGKRKNVEWNASSDWAAIYPFVLADTIGGDRKTERYSFQGGCATRLGLWTIGEQLTFLAEHEWSTHDPRMRGIVTDLKARVGASRVLLNHYLALGAMLKLYKQTNSVEFFRQEGRVAEYQMSGLGNWYERFSGSNDKSYYKATGYGLDLGVAPRTSRNGLLLNAGYDYSPYRRILSSLNALPIQRLYVTRWDARIGWQHITGNNNKNGAVSLWVGLNGEKRRGDEIIGGESTADEYVVRGYLTMYKNRLTDIYGGGCWMIGVGSNNTVTLLVQGGHQKYTSSFAFPYSSLDFSKNHIGGKAQWQTHGRRWAIDTNVACEYYKNNSGSHTTLEEVTFESPLADDVAQKKNSMIEHCTAQALASYLQLTMNIRAQWTPQFMGSMGLFAELGAAYRSNDAMDDNRGYLLNATLGITF